VGVLVQWRQRKPTRVVTGTVCDRNDDIAALVGNWGSASEAQVFSDIRSGTVDYLVMGPDGHSYPISIRAGRTADFLWVSWDAEGLNNLDDLERRRAAVAVEGEPAPARESV
jgi:hypothetical protein